MKKDLEKVGMAGQTVKVSPGYAQNFLIPNGYAVLINEKSQSFFDNINKKIQVEKAVLASKVAMMAERLKHVHITIKEKSHDGGKLYGSVGEEEIVAALKDKGFIINKKQVVFRKSIKTLGEHSVVIKLNADLQPEVSVKVVAANVEKTA